MLYRETGQFKTTYQRDMAIFPIRQDRWVLIAAVVFAVVGIPFIASQHVIAGYLIPFLIWVIAAIGLNILTGYTGQLSLGHGAFMAVGAYSAYNFASRIPELPIVLVFILAGLVAAIFGVLVGSPSLRIKGFYLAVATLAAQFFVEWVFATFPWFVGGAASMVIDTPKMDIFGYPITSTLDNYYLVLGFVVVMTLLGKNLVRSAIGRSWMAIRDMDVAAEVIGIRPLYAKLSAFAVSSFFGGVAGALYAFCYVKSVDFTAFDLFVSLKVLFMIIIGGMGSILGCFLGAAFIVMLPIILNELAHGIFSGQIPSALISNLEHMIFGGLIIFFLIVEPHGLARLWMTAKEKFRLWPFPH